MASPGSLNRNDSEYSLTPGLKENSRYAHIAMKYLDNGLLRQAVDALGLDNDAHLESLFLELRSSWDSAAREINSLEMNLNQVSGELSDSATTIEDFIFGRDVAGTDDVDVDGRMMFQAVKKMAIFVVDRTGLIKSERQRHLNEGIVTRMSIEAIHALQHDRKCMFRDALLSESLRKVELYPSSQQGYGETVAKFRLREIKNELVEERATSSKRIWYTENDNYEFKQKNKDLQETIKALKDERQVLPSYQGDKSDTQFEIRELQAKLAACNTSELEGYHEKRKLQLELGFEQSLHRMTEDKRRELRHKLERRDLEILQLKQNMEVLHELSEQKLQAAEDKFQKELKDAKTTLKKVSDKLSDVEHTNEFLGEEVEEQAVKIGYQAHEIKTQAEKIKSLVQGSRGEIASPRVL
jgi:hypothetical protein